MDKQGFAPPTDTPVGRLRVLTGDTAYTDFDPETSLAEYAIWGDDAILLALTTAGDSPYRAAANLFSALAAEYMQLGRSIRTDDLAINTNGRGADLLEVAKSFYEQGNAADADAAGSFFAVVPIVRESVSTVRPEGTPWPRFGGVL